MHLLLVAGQSINGAAAGQPRIHKPAGKLLLKCRRCRFTLLLLLQWLPLVPAVVVLAAAPATHSPTRSFPFLPSQELGVPYEDEGSFVVVKHAALMTSTLLSKVGGGH